MGVGILAPVPANILKSALETCADAGRVAFGSNAWEVFNRLDLEYGEGLPVLIYATHHYGDPDKLCDVGYANFHGVYLRTKLAQGGKHPNPSVRPIVTVEGPAADTPWAFFWAISDLVQLGKHERVAIASLTAEGQKKSLANGFVPHGPMLVKAQTL
jgi:hypothetical protein